MDLGTGRCESGVPVDLISWMEIGKIGGVVIAGVVVDIDITVHRILALGVVEIDMVVFEILAVFRWQSGFQISVQFLSDDFLFCL